MTMYRITKIFFTDEFGKRKGVDKTIEVPDLEKYRKTLEIKEHKEVNFVYETKNED